MKKKLKLFFRIIAISITLILIATFFLNPLIKPMIVLPYILNGKSEEIYEQNGYSLEIWSQINNNPPTRYSKTVDFDDTVRLIAVVNYYGKRYSNNELLNNSKQTIPLSKLDAEIKFYWYKLEPYFRFYSKRNPAELEISKIAKGNTKEVLLWIFDYLELDKLKYKETRFGWNNSFVEINQESTTNQPIKWKEKYVGTMRYKVEMKIDGNRISSQGKAMLESKNKNDWDKVHRISVKADTRNKFLDFAFSCGNLPYFYGNSDYYGADCSGLVSHVYRKTTGKIKGYLSTWALIKLPAKKTITDIDGIFYLSNGNKIEYGKDVEEGDIIVMNPRPHHTGLIGEDKNGNGFLDINDYVFHTSGKAPEYVQLKNTVFGKMPAKGTRFKILN